MIAPALAGAALIAPSVIALFDGTSLHPPLAWLGGQANLPSGEIFSVQSALLTIGLSIGLASGALAVYRWRVIRRLIHLFIFFSLLELFYRFAYGGPVSSGLLLSVPETSERETVELLAGHLILSWSLALIAILAVYALVISWSADIRFPVRRCMQAGAVSLSMIVASLAIGMHQFGAIRILKVAVPAQVQATFPFDIASAFGAVAIDWVDTCRHASARARFRFPDAQMVNRASREAESEIYVVVIGETSRRTNWSLFGYSRITTPRLDAIKNDLIVFNRVNSNATNTILSLPLALTRAAPASRGIAHSEKSIITLLNQAGYETFWISNQTRSNVSNPISQIAFEADHVSFPDDMQLQARTGGYDSNLLSRLNDRLSRLGKGSKAVIFLHMEGSHFGYKDRYPASFRHFRDGQDLPRSLPDRQMRLVNEYDNSVYFTDYNLRGVIDRLASCGGKTGLIFFSDHGERLFDSGLTDSDFGHGFPTVSRQEIEIPFLVWLSRAYQDANPSLVARLKANAQSVAQLHNLFETIVDLAGVDYENRASALSLFSGELQSPSTLSVLNMEQKTVSLPVDKDSGEL